MECFECLEHGKPKKRIGFFFCCWLQQASVCSFLAGLVPAGWRWQMSLSLLPTTLVPIGMCGVI